MALERLLFLEREGRVGYRHGDDGAELERMDYLELMIRKVYGEWSVLVWRLS